MTRHCFKVPQTPIPWTLERFVAAELERDYLEVRRWVQAGHISVDGRQAKTRSRLQPGQTITVEPPPPAPHPALPEDLPLPLRYLDQDLLVVAKPAGMATHPGPGWWHGSCVNALLHAISDWPGIGGVAGPGIVHRLDRDTTGLLIFARSARAHQALLQAMRERRIARQYLAWVTGQLAGEGSIDLPLGRDPLRPEYMSVQTGGKRALTHYRTLVSGSEQSLLALRLETGRLHQIRTHLAHLGHPIWGDPAYGSDGPFMALHAAELSFTHPVSGETLHFHEPVPPAWQILGSMPAPL